MNKLAVLLLGNHHAGKTATWNLLFDTDNVRADRRLRPLNLTEEEYVNVFLVNRSPQEQKKKVEEIIGSQNPDIVLCAVQYKKEGMETIDYFIKNGYYIYCQWLNPGYNDEKKIQMYDKLGLVNYILSHNSTLTIQNGQKDVSIRAERIREFLYGWAKYRNLICSW